ncbi:TetR/AcrR family transcriptional regulator [Galbibacter sp. EGI 63066]|uniref:TetR/AcrR family transcriptional regulator n=1 Tax=Galbibacter sp. EGI 63066 TaxID=2993559 RepID=UPI0022491118|nr:TetR/AcrR family transcriptional regulator [Galbibacter sp. EGI 63066]MCX2678874.1 TetR/AcrR family transcriptional regulator [Galbibacter sp. EGI 63066]
MKEKILDKSAEMFITLGFKSVTMDDIALSLGISKKTIYQHFKNKGDLVDSAVFHLSESICEGIDYICEVSNNPIEELFHIKKFVSDYLKDEKSSPHFQLKKYYPGTYNRLLRKQFEMMQDCVTENIKKGIKCGMFRKEVGIDFVSRIYFSGMIGIKDEDIFPPDIFSQSDLKSKYLEYHIRAIATEKGIEVLKEFINENKD